MKKITFIVGPSGCGKTHLRDRLLKLNPDKYCEIRSTVSRKARKGEDINAYHFVRRNEFEDLIKSDGLLQHVHWGGNYYGTTLKEYEQPQPNGLFICTPVGIPDTVKALKSRNIDMEVEILLFMTTNKLLEKHGVEKDRIGRGSILHEFLDRYTANEFEGINIEFIIDSDVDDELHEKLNYIL